MNTLKIFQPLFKTNKHGRIQEWKLSVIEDNLNKIYIKSEYGLIGGKYRTNLEHIIQAKSKENIEEQAIFNATRYWKDKKNKQLYGTELKNSVENTKTSEIVISTDIRPMLAKTFTTKTKVKYPLISQRKLDGTRSQGYSENGHIIMVTRNGIKFYSEVVKYITSQLQVTLPENIILDGEIFNPDITFQQLQRIIKLKKKPKKDMTAEFCSLKFYVFDLINLADLDMGFSDRYKMLEQIVEEINVKFKENNIVLVKNDIIHSREDIEKFHILYEDEGNEGLMLRTMDGKYGINKRTSDLIKKKNFMDSEFKIIDTSVEHNNGKELVIWVCETEDKQPFNCRPIGSVDYKENLLKNREKYIGCFLTVEYQELSDDGIPRFPRGKAIRMDIG